MNLHRRITRVEERMGRRGPCPLCHGQGWHHHVVRRPGDPPAPPPGCPVCGAVPQHYKVLIRSGVDPPLPPEWSP